MKKRLRGARRPPSHHPAGGSKPAVGTSGYVATVPLAATTPIRPPASSTGSDQRLWELNRELTAGISSVDQQAINRSALSLFDERILHDHPERARMALLVCASHQRAGDVSASLRVARLAAGWGCERRLLARVLIGGVHASLGRAATLLGLSDGRTCYHVQQSKSGIGFELESEQRPAGELPVQPPLPRAGAPSTLVDRQSRTAAVASAMQPMPVNPHAPLSEGLPGSLADLPLAIDGLLSTDEDTRQFALDQAASAIAGPAGTCPPPTLSLSRFRFRGRLFSFLHVAGDHIPRMMLRAGNFYEAAFLELLEQFHRVGGTVIDCGANIGNHSVFFAAVLEARVVAFEPEPCNAAILRVNCRLNSTAPRVNIFPLALGARRGAATLTMTIPNNHGSFSAVRSIQEEGASSAAPSERAVQIETLDAMAPALGDSLISIIKIDVEGMELEVLVGASTTIARDLPLIAVECHTREIFQQIDDFLGAQGYHVLDVLNATPTFVFINRRNRLHTRCLETFLATGVQLRARANAGYAPTPSD